MHNFRKLDIWNKSMDLAVDIYHATESFPKEETYGLRSQIRRCSVSVPSNIAEGASRNTPGQFNQFLGIATGSGGELITQTILSERLGFLTKEKSERIVGETEHIMNSIGRLQSTLKAK